MHELALCDAMLKMVRDISREQALEGVRSITVRVGTLSGVVPVVGSMLSDASETLVVSAGVLRNSIGVFGMLAVLALCAAPFLQTGLTYLVLKLTAAVGGAEQGGQAVAALRRQHFI